MRDQGRYCILKPGTRVKMRVTIIGGGAWGTALSRVAAEEGHQVRVWVYETEVARAINEQHENPVYLPGVKLDEGIRASSDMEESLQGAELVVVVVPSHFVRKVMSEAALHVPEGAYLASATKGIEDDTLLTMSGVLAEVLPPAVSRNLVVISGPSFAKEVAKKVPTAVVAAAHDLRVAEKVQHSLAAAYLRIYSQTDVIGVELGGTVKNPIAIAAGICDGMELGLNARSALITRGLAEMARLGMRMGANPMTFAGLAGLGDLVLTCTGHLSRNYTVGVKIGQGQSLDEILAEMKSVAEGVRNAATVYKLAKKMDVDMPIIEQIHRVLYENKPPKAAVRDLMTRELKSELGI